MRSLFAFMFIIAIIALTTNIATVEATPKRTTSFKSAEVEDKHSIVVTIEDAWYGNDDNGTTPNDVLVVVQFKLQGSKTYNLEYYIQLELPSGAYFIYKVDVVAKIQTFNLTNVFWNHATEPGWYCATVIARLNTGGPLYAGTQHIFDPPGNDDSDPKGFGVRL